MKKCNHSETIERKNSENCIAREFPIQDDDIGFAIVKVSARYPETGRATNKLCKEIVYVHEGSGKVIVDGKECLLGAGDVVLIDKNEKFYWDGKMTLHISCTPAFTVEQHIHIE